MVMNENLMRAIFFSFLLIAIVSGMASSQDSVLENSPTGKRALAYFAAFNSGDDAKLAAFFAENTDTEALKRRPVEQRVAFHKQVRSDFKQLAIQKVVSVTSDEIVVLARSPEGRWASLTFEIEPSGKFAGVGVEMIDAPSAGNETPQRAPATLAELGPAADALFSDLVKQGRFSGVVLIAKGDTQLVSKAYGYANIDKKTENNIDTRFNLGSINKFFTRIAIGQLVKQGKLSFNDKLISVLPDYPSREIASKITIGQLVTMTSGLGDFFNSKFQAADKGKIRSLGDYVPLFVDEPLLFEPGTKNSYSNAGYLVLGLVVEKLSGKSYYDYVRENIFVPAGMSKSGWFAIDELPANTATGYTAASGKHTPNTSSLPARGSSAGGGYSTAGDMLKLSAALLNKKLSVPDDNGVFPADVSGVGIAGGTPGVNALFMVMPRQGFTVVVLSNFDPPSAERPGTLIRSWLAQMTQ